MDDSALKNLSIKALKSYLRHYNIPTAGMIEKSGMFSGSDLSAPVAANGDLLIESHLTHNRTYQGCQG